MHIGLVLAAPRRVPIRPGTLDQRPPDAAVSGFGDAGAAHRVASRSLAWHQAGTDHELARPVEPAEVAHLARSAGLGHGNGVLHSRRVGPDKDGMLSSATARPPALRTGPPMRATPVHPCIVGQATRLKPEIRAYATTDAGSALRRKVAGWATRRR